MSSEKDDKKQTIKPALTEVSVQRLIQPLLGQQTPDKRAQKLGKDWRAFIAAELRLSKTQADNLRAIPAVEVDKVQRAFHEAIKHGGELRLTLGSAGAGARAGKDGELVIHGATAGAAARSFTIPLVKCTFDANCRNWKCKLGPSL